ncbi:MAG TPA: hypothetical protein VLU92_11245 [Candidatus Dormibacteraeota bacterium]|nr:hypothetical protein [Candidatus Dormibacteraeota bacterium]
MKRMTIGAALGGAAMYLLDPQQGEDRRRRMQSLWQDNRDTALEVGNGVSQAAESMGPLVRRMKRGLERGDWAEDDGPKWVPVVTGVVVATALGGALVYFLDSENGPRRRQRVVSFFEEQQRALKGRFRSVQKAANTVRPRAKRTVDKASEAVEDVRVGGRG